MTPTELSPSSSSSSEAYLAASASPSSAADDRLQSAVQQLICNTGEQQLVREGLQATPLRVAKAWREATRGQKHDVRSALGGGLFQEESVNRGRGGLILVRDIEFASTSEHTLLPFFGKCHVGYFPASGVVLGLSKAARLADYFSRKLQSQQEFTQNLLACLLHHIQPYGAAVCVVARHLGSSHTAGVQITTAGSGSFDATQSPSMQEFMSILQFHSCLPSLSDRRCQAASMPQPMHLVQQPQAGVNRVFSRNGKGGTVRLPDSVPQGCDLTDGDAALRQLQMEHAVEAILLELGENTSRQGLAGSVGRYVSFMQEATAGYSQEPALARALAAAQRTMALGAAVPQHSLPAPQIMHANFSSLCEHHLLPFQGVLRVAMCTSPSGPAWLVLQSLVKQLASCYARRLQIQERLTHEIADALLPLAERGSLLVVCDAVHMCMVARGVEQHASSTLTVVARGCFENDASLRAESLQQMLERPQISTEQ